MSDRKQILITGATGFLGSHLAARVLQTGAHVTAIARGSKNASARTRVEEALRDIGGTPFERLTVLEGDISMPGLGLKESQKEMVLSSTEEVWHCAASLSFQEEDREE